MTWINMEVIVMSDGPTIKRVGQHGVTEIQAIPEGIVIHYGDKRRDRVIGLPYILTQENVDD